MSTETLTREQYLSQAQSTGKKNKYGAKRKTVDGVNFHSSREADFYLALRLLERARQVTSITLQPRYPIIINGVKVCDVILDFRYREQPSGRVIIVDVKGFDTSESKLKRKLFEAAYPGLHVKVVK